MYLISGKYILVSYYLVFCWTGRGIMRTIILSVIDYKLR